MALMFSCDTFSIRLDYNLVRNKCHCNLYAVISVNIILHIHRIFDALTLTNHLIASHTHTNTLMHVPLDKCLFSECA